MGLCFSCRKSKDRFKVKGSKICSQIHSVVLPVHETISSNSSSPPHYLNGCTTIITTNNNLNLIAATTGGIVCVKTNSKSCERMATSFPNMSITNPIKGLVSKNRNRYQKDGFDLDLTYITPNIIAMGYPASSIEGVYRNRIDDVVKFLDSTHKDHYYIYNLCSERSYDKAKFHNRVHVFPFDDHNPPKIESIQPFCKSVKEWLSKDERNVVAVHCKAGKGRTGTMICCYLLHSGISATAEQALSYYGQTRTQDRKGVTIPSQMRYVRYYEALLRQNFNYTPVLMNIKEFQLNPVPSFATGGCQISFVISQQTLTDNGDERVQQKCKNEVYEVKKGCGAPFIIKLDYCLPLSGDIKVEFYKVKLGRRDRLFRFWFNTSFVCEQRYGISGDVNGYTDHNGSSCGDSTNDVNYKLVFKRKDLDLLSKKLKSSDMDFELTLHLQKVPSTEHSNERTYVRMPSSLEQVGVGGASTDSSESSDDFTNEEDDWDSVMDGDHLDPRGVGYRILSECEIASQLTSSSSDQQPELLIV